MKQLTHSKVIIYFLITALLLPLLPRPTRAAEGEVSGFSIDSMLSAHQSASVNSQQAGDFAANSFDGSAGYNYNFQLPANRHNFSPVLGLNYNSGNKNNFNPAGYGWNLTGLNYIERINSDGINNIYQSEVFTINLNGSSRKIVNYRDEISQSNNIYEFSDNKWILKDTSGNTYYFGSTDTTRLGNEKTFYNDQQNIKPEEFCQKLIKSAKIALLENNVKLIFSIAIINLILNNKVL